MPTQTTTPRTAAYRLHRIGEFTVKTTGLNHCGTTDVLTIRYTLTVRCPAVALDSRGFLFDQTRVQAWFNGQVTTDLSCEAYAAHCAREIYKQIRKENPGIAVSSLELALSPAPYMAEITFSWDGTHTAKTATKPIEQYAAKPSQAPLFRFMM